MRKESIMTTKKLFEKYENVTLRRFAQALELNYNMVLKIARKPIEGVPYDPTATNYDELDALIARREINLDEVDWKEVNAQPTRTSTATLPKNIDEFEVGTKCYLRDDNENAYEVLYKTGTHIVIMKEGTTEPRALSYNTFFFKGPSFEKREERVKEEEA